MSLCRCSFVCVRHSIFYVCVTCCDLDVTMRRHDKSETAREKARGKNNNNDLSYVPSKRKEEIKSGTSGCGSFVVAYFRPATSTTDYSPTVSDEAKIIDDFRKITGKDNLTVFSYSGSNSPLSNTLIVP